MQTKCDLQWKKVTEHDRIETIYSKNTGAGIKRKGNAQYDE